LPVGGRFAFDVISKRAATTSLIRNKYQTVRVKEKAIHRRMLKRFDHSTAVITAFLRFWVCGNGHVTHGWREVHRLRAFDPIEVRNALSQSEFAEVSIASFDNANIQSDLDSAWSFLVVAEAI
jgi:hypothetical protein